MIEVHLVAGDKMGGPYVHATLDLDREVDDLKDEEFDQWHKALITMFKSSVGNGEAPEQIICYAEPIDFEEGNE